MSNVAVIGLEYKEPQETAFSWAIRERASR